MSVPVIRVVAERIDDIVGEALDALRATRLDIRLDEDADLTFTKRDGTRGPLRTRDLRVLLAEAALWVDAQGIPIEPPPVIVRAVDCLLFEREVAR